VWDSYLKSDIDKLERVQRKAARFIKGDYKSRDPGCVTKILDDLKLPILHQRRKELILTFLYKVVKGLVSAIPLSQYLTHVRNTRLIRVKRFTDFETSNIVDKQKMSNTKCLQPRDYKSVIYQDSVFVRSVNEWNQLENSCVTAKTVNAFKISLHLD